MKKYIHSTLACDVVVVTGKSDNLYYELHIEIVILRRSFNRSAVLLIFFVFCITSRANGLLEMLTAANERRRAQ